MGGRSDRVSLVPSANNSLLSAVNGVPPGAGWCGRMRAPHSAEIKKDEAVRSQFRALRWGSCNRGEPRFHVRGGLAGYAPPTRLTTSQLSSPALRRLGPSLVLTLAANRRISLCGESCGTSSPGGYNGAAPVFKQRAYLVMTLLMFYKTYVAECVLITNTTC